MKKKLLTVLLIEDHPIIIEAYRQGIKLFEETNLGYLFHIHTATNCDEALESIKRFNTNNKKVDIIFLDIKIPPSKTNPQIKSGEDIGKRVRMDLPESKIIIATMITGYYVINSIFKTLNPEGFLIKNDITHEEIIFTLEKVCTNNIYYSKTVMNSIQKKMNNDFEIEDLDRHILEELSLGAKTNEIDKFMALSRSSINRRKIKLKILLDLDENASDRELVLRAKQIGII